MFNQLQRRFQQLQFTRKHQIAFLEDLASLIEDGVPVSQAVDTIREISEGITRGVSTDIAIEIAKGRLLADGMQGWFARPIVEVIRAGENSGTLIQALHAATQMASQQTNAVLTLINAVLYPIAVIIVALIVVVFIKNSVLNNFIQILPLARWPDIGKSLYHLGEFMQYWWWLLGLLIIALIIVIAKLLHNLTGSPRRMLDSFPLLSLYRDITAARFMETLGLLIANGIVLKQALSIMHKEAQPYLSWHLLNMEYRLSGGRENIADVLDTDLIRREDIIRLRVVAKGKGFEHALVSLGRKASVRTAKNISLAGKIFGALLLILGAFIAATVVIGIYTVGSSVAAAAG